MVSPSILRSPEFLIVIFSSLIGGVYGGKSSAGEHSFILKRAFPDVTERDILFNEMDVMESFSDRMTCKNRCAFTHIKPSSSTEASILSKRVN